MGFHTRECKRCRLSLLGTMAVVHANRWLSDGVAITEDGTVHTGLYDGYGSLSGEHVIDVFPDTPPGTPPGDPLPVSVWHRSCWVLDGSPNTFQGDSDYAADQGWFFDEDRYKVRDPLTI